MDDWLSGRISAESDRIDVPHVSVKRAMQRGRALRVRRVVMTALSALGVVLLAIAVVRALPLDDPKLQPAAPDATTVKDNTLLSIVTDHPAFDERDHYVAVSLEEGRTAMVCFALPLWADQATIQNSSGDIVGTFPGLSTEESDTSRVSCGRADEDDLTSLATSPQLHVLDISGAEEEVRARLALERAWDFGEETDETKLLEYQASQAIDNDDLALAERLGHQRLNNAPPPSNWDHGNAIHYGNLILGHVALRRDDAEGAKRHLLQAGRTSGSPQLNSFGPNMSLARDLLLVGETDAVLDYLDLIAEFWEFDSPVEEWRRDIEDGRQPDFGSNLGTGYLEPSDV